MDLIKMNYSLNKIDCIKRLIKIGQSKTEMIDFLLSENILTIDEVKQLETDDFALTFFLKMTKALESGKIMLFDFSWIILPKEQIAITIVSNSGTKQFTYSEL